MKKLLSKPPKNFSFDQAAVIVIDGGMITHATQEGDLLSESNQQNFNYS